MRQDTHICVYSLRGELEASVCTKQGGTGTALLHTSYCCFAFEQLESILAQCRVVLQQHQVLAHVHQM
jgi:hypothetical protein